MYKKYYVNRNFLKFFKQKYLIKLGTNKKKLTYAFSEVTVFKK
jgi:hypothetical protein